MSECWFAGRPGIDPCQGRMDRMHWVKQQAIRARFPHGAYRVDGGEWVRTPRLMDPADFEGRALDMRSMQQIVWDGRVWAGACRWHHGTFDRPGVRALRVPRAELPVDVEEWAAEFGMVWWLDRTYGERA